MGEIKAIKLDRERYLYVEVDEAEVPAVSHRVQKGVSDQPEGSELTGLKEMVGSTVQTLQDSISSLFDTIYEGFRENQPSEWALEVNIGFKGKANPVPVILGAETQGGIKITAKWKRSE